MLMDCTLLFTHTCPVTEFAVAPHLNTEKSCCHHVFLRHVRFQKRLPVNNYSIPGHLRVLFQLFLQTGRKIAMMGVLASEGDCAVGESFRCMAVIFASAI